MKNSERMSSNQTALKDRISAAEGNLGRLLDWNGRYDNKSSALLGIDTGMLGALAILEHGNLSQTSVAIVSFFAIGLLGLGFVFIFAGSYPRLKAPEDSILFFQTSAKKKLEDYRDAFVNQTNEKYLEDLVGQCHRNSEILTVKFRYLSWSFRFIIVAIIPWAIALYLS